MAVAADANSAGCGLVCVACCSLTNVSLLFLVWWYAVYYDCCCRMFSFVVVVFWLVVGVCGCVWFVVCDVSCWC